MFATETIQHQLHIRTYPTHSRSFIPGALAKASLRFLVEILDEVVVVSNGVSRVKRSAFNAIAVDTKEFQNSTKNLSDALAKAPGMKLRESGGVGSDMQLMLDGFSGKHVKIFIDGVPQEGVGSSFGLNNIPVNFADRIEVYKGVVPVGFGTDAIGGVINIVTNKKRRNWFLDGSYSYGSFNTHKSYVNFGQTFKNGFTYEINAFQNYSDNDYHVDAPVEDFASRGNGSTQISIQLSMEKLMDIQMISYDKVNQLRHVLFLQDKAHTLALMQKHAAILRPKFRCVLRCRQHADRALLAVRCGKEFTGGHSAVVNTLPGLAKRTLALCKEAGVTMTGAGATFPYGVDPQDSNIRIAPSLPPVEELEKAMEVFCVCLRMAALEQLLQE